ncbi:MAG: cyclodeaminase/cyclohydrolase family protein [Actinobacteria bacterium]|nr:MAG: cyclodeaminase/cyclohydrolase family protein [Actinomycetota bacterium]
MASPRPYLELTLGEWLDELAHSQGAPGGGSALGFAVATGAAVLAMAARESGAPGLCAQAEALRARTAPLAQLDAETYDEALASRDGKDALRPEQRDWEIGRAFARAAEPPLEIARAGADVAELAAQLAASGDLRVRADALAAAALGVAAARGAVSLVATNLTALDGDPRVAEAEQLAATAERFAAGARRT